MMINLIKSQKLKENSIVEDCFEVNLQPGSQSQASQMMQK